MCLAVPGKVVECRGGEALVDFLGNTASVSTALTPDINAGEWVLVHAGFAITRIDESAALETWEYLRAAYSTELSDEFDAQNAASQMGGGT